MRVRSRRHRLRSWRAPRAVSGGIDGYDEASAVDRRGARRTAPSVAGADRAGGRATALQRGMAALADGAWPGRVASLQRACLEDRCHRPCVMGLRPSTTCRCCRSVAVSRRVPVLPASGRLSPMAPYVLSARTPANRLMSAQLGTSRACAGNARAGRSRVAHGRRAPVVRGERTSFGPQLWRSQLFSCGRSSCASRTDASISTRLIETLSTLIPNGTPSVRQYVISSVAVVRACW
jgi:hypothetical protein